MLQETYKKKIGICNGALGEVIEYDEKTQKVGILFQSKFVNKGNIYYMNKTCITVYISHLGLVWRTQFPLKLGFASTLHYIQGLTLDKVHFLNDHNRFGCGENYTAISRCKVLKNVSVEREFRLSDFKPNTLFENFIEHVPMYNFKNTIRDLKKNRKLFYCNCQRKPNEVIRIAEKFDVTRE